MLVCFHRSPDYDERASIDISLGIRPKMVTDSLGNLTTDLHYENVIGKNQFKHHEYIEHRTSDKVFRSVMKDNTNSFLYYLLLQKWSLVVGVGLFKMRMFSVIVSWLSLISFFRILVHLLPEKPLIPWIAVVLLFSNPFFFYASCSIRGYVLSLFFLLLALKLILDVRQKRENTLRYPAITALACAALFCHYYILAGVVPVICQLSTMPEPRKLSVREKISIFICLLAFLLTCLTWWNLCKPEGLYWLEKFHATLRVTNNGTPYSFAGTNFLRQIFQLAGIIAAPAAKITEIARYLRIGYLGIALCLLVGGMLTIKSGNTHALSGVKKNGWLFLYFGIIPVLLYSIEAFWAGQLTIFLPQYALLLLPGVYIGLFVLAKSVALPLPAIVISKILLVYLIFGNVIATTFIIYDNSKHSIADSQKANEIIYQMKNNKSNGIMLAGTDLSVLTMQTIASAISSTNKIKFIRFKDHRDAQFLNYFSISDSISQTVIPSPPSYSSFPTKQSNPSLANWRRLHKPEKQ